MTTTTDKPKLTELMLPEDQYPALTPSPVDVLSYKGKLATALTKCETQDYKRGGHLYLVLDPQEYRAKLEDPTAVYPTAPARPVKPVATGTTPVSSSAYEDYKESKVIYADHLRYDQQARDLLAAKFPKSLKGLKKGGEFRFELTAKQMLKHLDKGTDDSALRNRCAREVLNRLINRPYISTPNGAEEWFADADEDRDLIIQLGHTPQPYGNIMTTALGVFMDSDLPDERIRDLETTWWKMRKDEHLEADDLDTFLVFQEFYNEQLRHLHSTATRNRLKKANQATEVTRDDLTTVREEIAQVQDNMYATMEHNFQTIQCSIATPATDDSTLAATHRDAAYATGTSDHTMATILEKLDHKIDQLSQKVAANEQRPRPRRTWRQFNKYCWTHGVNASHTSGQCDQKRRGHDNDATHADRRGGSDKNADGWKKWLSPEGTIHDNKGN